MITSASSSGTGIGHSFKNSPFGICTVRLGVESLPRSITSAPSASATAVIPVIDMHSDEGKNPPDDSAT